MSRPINTFPPLPQLKIASPCSEDWEAMAGDDRSRFCQHCSKSVHNFSEMTAQEIRSVMQSGKNICAQITRTQDGRVVTKEIQTGTRRSALLLTRLTTLAAALFAMITLNGCQQNTAALGEVDGPHPVDIEPLRGEVMAVPESGEVCPTEMGDVAFEEIPNGESGSLQPRSR